ncbi:MAG: hypothetical protein Q4E63_02060 [Prevotellaceae bacterium]|nr:hypothetical protein [Prevotellaceae bacterium]
MSFTKAIISEAFGQPKDASPYANILASGYTDLQLNDINPLLKSLEKDMGDTPALRAEGIVMMDIDILEYAGRQYHVNDWERPYIKRLLSLLVKGLFFVLSITLPSMECTAQSAGRNSELLGKAVEYYQSGKYHECIISFEKLQKQYTLTPRFMAWLGFSYYKEQNYKDAAKALRTAIPHLETLSPKERATYLYVCAESLFYLEDYNEAIKYYNMALPLTGGNDKGDVLFHTAFAHYLINNENTDTITVSTEKARLLFTQALTLYKDNSSTATPQQRARMKQTEKMLKGMTP